MVQERKWFNLSYSTEPFVAFEIHLERIKKGEPIIDDFIKGPNLSYTDVPGGPGGYEQPSRKKHS